MTASFIILKPSHVSHRIKFKRGTKFPDTPWSASRYPFLSCSPSPFPPSIHHRSSLLTANGWRECGELSPFNVLKNDGFSGIKAARGGKTDWAVLFHLPKITFNQYLEITDKEKIVYVEITRLTRVSTLSVAKVGSWDGPDSSWHLPVFSRAFTSLPAVTRTATSPFPPVSDFPAPKSRLEKVSVEEMENTYSIFHIQCVFFSALLRVLRGTGNRGMEWKWNSLWIHSHWELAKAVPWDWTGDWILGRFSRFPLTWRCCDAFSSLSPAPLSVRYCRHPSFPFFMF